MLTRDLYKRYLNPSASHDQQKLWGRIGVAFIVLSALMVATFSRDALVLLGGLAVAFGFQMWPSLAGVTWFPWITRQGATWGLAAGLLAVIFTIRRRVAVGSLALDDAFSWLGYYLQPCRLSAGLSYDAGRNFSFSSHEVSQLPA